MAGKPITKAVVSTLLGKGRTRLASGFRGPDGTEARGRLVLDGTDVRVELEGEEPSAS
jgi:hypothetical protein